MQLYSFIAKENDQSTRNDYRLKLNSVSFKVGSRIKKSFEAIVLYLKGYFEVHYIKRSKDDYIFVSKVHLQLMIQTKLFQITIHMFHKQEFI